MKEVPTWATGKVERVDRKDVLKLGRRMKMMTEDEMRRVQRARYASAAAALVRMVPGPSSVPRGL